VPLETSMQRRAGEVRDRRLKGVRAIVQWQQGMTPQCDDDGLLSLAENGGTWLLRPGPQILHRLPLAPFGDGFDVDAKLPAQFRVRSLRSLYRCSDGVRSRGAAVAYLSHKAPFHSGEWIAPSNHGIKHLIHSLRPLMQKFFIRSERGAFCPASARRGSTVRASPYGSWMNGRDPWREISRNSFGPIRASSTGDRSHHF
jgi:hypothetical protein